MEKQFGRQFTLCGHQGGMIPIYNKNLVVKKGNIMIVGDAATHVKATTGGGIIPGMMGAREIVELLGKEIIKNKDLRLDKELRLHYIARMILNRFTNKDYNYLIKLCNKEKVKKILEKESRDKPSKFMFKLLGKEPRLLYFLKNLL